MALIRFILISIAILWLVRMIARVLLPMIFRNLVSKAQQHVSQQYSQQYQQPRKPEGKVIVDYVPPKDKEAKASDKAGDFIDFEEIK